MDEAPKRLARDLPLQREAVQLAEAAVERSAAGGVVHVPQAQPGRLQREAALLLAPPQRRLAPPALGDVAEDRLHREPAVEQDRGRGCLDHDLGAVEAAQRQLDWLVALVRRPQPRRAGARQFEARLVDQREGRDADQVLRPRGAEQGCRLPIGEDDHAVAVDVDGVGRGLDQGPVALLALLQRRLDPGPVGGVAALRSVRAVDGILPAVSAAGIGGDADLDGAAQRGEPGDELIERDRLELAAEDLGEGRPVGPAKPRGFGRRQGPTADRVGDSGGEHSLSARRTRCGALDAGSAGGRARPLGGGHPESPPKRNCRVDRSGARLGPGGPWNRPGGRSSARPGEGRAGPRVGVPAATFTRAGTRAHSRCFPCDCVIGNRPS
jgi:hypothetical protein